MVKPSVHNVRCSNKSLKRLSLSSSPVEISNSTSEDSHDSSSLLIKKPSGSFPKKENLEYLLYFDLEDMQKFWNVSEKRKFLAFKNRPFAHGKVICLAQLDAL
ncbi:hypothetical protein HAX54_042387 [Datura stramonium]|uniref:Uncharacterized protein n=1 Tax=Datura stramonium TaxID=4076 RepID=A0ABS8W120_DATST|nr:hypothetical protein [Datura stramonium]